MPEGVHPPELSDAKVIRNLEGKHKYSYCVFMIDYEGEKDGIMFGFVLPHYPDFAICLHLPASLSDEILEKYSFVSDPEVENLTITEFLVSENNSFFLN